MRAGVTCIFANDLLQGRCQDPPWEDLHVLLDVARFGVRKPHDQLEEVLAIRLSLRHRRWAETLKVSPDPILLLDREANCDQRLEQRDRVHTRDVTLLLLRPPDAADADGVWNAVLWSDRFETRGDDAAVLLASELNEASLCFPLLWCPFLYHCVEVASELDLSLGVRRVDCVRVEG